MSDPEALGSEREEYPDPESYPPPEVTDGETPDADLQVDDAVTPRSSGSREEPPRATTEQTGLVSPGSTADGAGTTT